MEFYKVMNLVEKGAGQFHSISWQRDCKTRAAFRGNRIIKKATCSAARFGVNFEAMASVKEKRESGELPPVNTGLKGLVYIVPNKILMNPKTGKTSLRVSLAPNSKVKTSYYLNGVEVQKNDIEHMLLKSELSGHSGANCFNINTDSITEIK